MKKVEVSITFITDHNYLMPTWVAAKSVVESKSDSVELSIYIVGDGLSSEDKERLLLVTEGSKDTNLVFIDVNSECDFKGKMDYTDLKSWSPAVLYKLTLCDILPANIHKIIYLDGDMLIRQDLLSLYNTDIDGYYLGGVRDTFYDVISHEQRMNLPGCYINTGCLLLNLDEMRKDNLADKLLKTKIDHPELGLADQDTYNEVCRGKILLLPLKYNFYITSFLMDEDIEGFRKYTTCPYESRRDMINDIAIIHLIHYRPWKLRLNEKEKSELLNEDKEYSIWDSAIKYIISKWYGYYCQSPFFKEDMSNILSTKSEETCLSLNGLHSYKKIGHIWGEIHQDCKQGRIHVNFSIRKLKVIEKVREPGENSKVIWLPKVCN